MRASGYRNGGNTRNPRVNTIENLAYKIYREKWVLEHVPKDEQLAVLRYYNKQAFADSEFRKTFPAFETYEQETGYSTGIYVCKAEFLENEFLDVEFMADLLEEDLRLFDAWAENKTIDARIVAKETRESEAAATQTAAPKSGRSATPSTFAKAYSVAANDIRTCVPNRDYEFEYTY